MRAGVIPRGLVVGSVPAQTTTAVPSDVPAQTLADYLPEWLLFPGWQFVTVLLFLLLGVSVSKFTVRLLGRRVARYFTRESVAQTVLRLARLTVTLVFLALGLNAVGIELGNIVLSVTVFSAVLGIVLAPIVGSIINGLFILADQPYEIGDMIELDDGTRGFVDDITLRYTKVFTLDNTFLVIPNSTIRERDVTNYSAEDERTRVSLPVLITYESDVPEARQLIERAASSTDQVIEGGPDIRIGTARYPAKPTCLIDSYADDGILLNLRYWVSRPYKLASVQSRVQEEIGRLLAEADVEFAYPHQHLVFDDTSGLARVTLEDGTLSADVDGAATTREAAEGRGDEDS
jgi:small-conductance mechanosensitive channel